MLGAVSDGRICAEGVTDLPAFASAWADAGGT